MNIGSMCGKAWASPNLSWTLSLRLNLVLRQGMKDSGSSEGKDGLLVWAISWSFVHWWTGCSSGSSPWSVRWSRSAIFLSVRRRPHEGMDHEPGFASLPMWHNQAFYKTNLPVCVSFLLGEISSVEQRCIQRYCSINTVICSILRFWNHEVESTLEVMWSNLWFS